MLRLYLRVQPTLLSCIVLTLNEQKHLGDCLASLNWADEVIVFDSFSTDNTEVTAKEHGVKFIQHKFENYGAQRDAALKATRADWVFFVDADERATPELEKEIRAVTASPSAVGWWVPRHNYIFGKLTLHAGWYPDYQLRLLKRDRAHYDPTRPVHELVKLDGAEGYLKSPLIHLNYETVDEFINKQNYYAHYDAERLRLEGKRAKLQNLITRPMQEFWRRFITYQGWRDGLHGLRLSLLMGYFQFVVYRSLYETQK